MQDKITTKTVSAKEAIKIGKEGGSIKEEGNTKVKDPEEEKEEAPEEDDFSKIQLSEMGTIGCVGIKLDTTENIVLDLYADTSKIQPVPI